MAMCVMSGCLSNVAWVSLGYPSKSLLRFSACMDCCYQTPAPDCSYKQVVPTPLSLKRGDRNDGLSSQAQSF